MKLKSYYLFIILILIKINYSYADFNPYIRIENQSNQIIYFTSDYHDYTYIGPGQVQDFTQVASGSAHSTIDTEAHIWDSNKNLMCKIHYNLDDKSDGVYTFENFFVVDPTTNPNDQLWAMRNIKSNQIGVYHLAADTKVKCSIKNITFGSISYKSYAAVKALIVINNL